LAIEIEIDLQDPVGKITTPWAKGDLVEVLGCLKVRGEHHIEHQDTGEQRDGEDE
jgi:hypothetical protein